MIEDPLYYLLNKRKRARFSLPSPEINPDMLIQIRRVVCKRKKMIRMEKDEVKMKSNEAAREEMRLKIIQDMKNTSERLRTKLIDLTKRRQDFQSEKHRLFGLLRKASVEDKEAKRLAKEQEKQRQLEEERKKKLEEERKRLEKLQQERKEREDREMREKLEYRKQQERERIRQQRNRRPRSKGVRHRQDPRTAVSDPRVVRAPPDQHKLHTSAHHTHFASWAPHDRY